MKTTMFKYAANRFVNPSKILFANVYTKLKQGTTAQPGEYNAIRVAIDLDSADKEKSTVYSDEFPDLMAAEAFILTIPCGQ